MDSRPDDRAWAGATLIIVGGLLLLIVSIYVVYVAAQVSGITSAAGFPVTSVYGLYVAGALGVLFSFIEIALGIALPNYPWRSVDIGISAIFVGFLSLIVFFGAEGIGFLLVVLGGACAIVSRSGSLVAPAKEPSDAQVTARVLAEIPHDPATPPPAQRCRRCGAALNPGYSFCPFCGQRAD
jgi:hypothetical protein